MAISAGEARREIARLIGQANADPSAVETLSENVSAVLMSKDEYDALVETRYLLRSPANAQRLMSGWAPVGRKRAQVRATEQDVVAEAYGNSS